MNIKQTLLIPCVFCACILPCACQYVCLCVCAIDLCKQMRTQKYVTTYGFIENTMVNAKLNTIIDDKL